LKRGQPNARRIALTLFRDAVEDLDGKNRETIITNLRKKVPETLPSGAK
jgi:hypothetical protein